LAQALQAQNDPKARVCVTFETTQIEAMVVFRSSTPFPDTSQSDRLDAWMTVAYPGVMLVALSGIANMYRHKGASTMITILLYIISLSTVKLSVKAVFLDHKFDYPRFLTACHLLMSAILGSSFSIWRWLYGDVPLPVPTRREIMLRLVPIATMWTASIGLENVALIFCSAAFTEIIGSLAPVLTVIVVFALGMGFNRKLLLPVLVVMLGCVISVKGELHFSRFGFVLCLASCICRSMKVALQQDVMTGEMKSKFEPFTLLTWQSMIAFFGMLSWSLVSEGSVPYTELAYSDYSRAGGIMLAVLLSSLNAAVLNLFGLFVTRELGALGVQVVSQAKAVLTVLGDVALLREPVSLIQMSGFAATLLGVFLFSRIEHDEAQETKKLSS